MVGNDPVEQEHQMLVPSRQLLTSSSLMHDRKSYETRGRKPAWDLYPVRTGHG